MSEIAMAAIIIIILNSVQTFVILQALSRIENLLK